jgi:hypothetical protein
VRRSIRSDWTEAVFPARDGEAIDAHWRRLLTDDSLVKRTIVGNGAVAGNIGCWTHDGLRLVGYWVGRDFWGRRLATTALAELPIKNPERPLHAWVAETNVGSTACSRSAASSRSSGAPAR